MARHASAPVVPPEATESWRTSMVRTLNDQGVAAGRTRRLVRHIEERLRRVATRAKDAYGTPHLGNWSDPTDELVFIVLSRKTPERAYVPAFAALKHLGTWEEVLRLGERSVERAIHGGGLEGKKARSIASGLRAVVERFGEADLSLAANLTDEELFTFLLSLPEVGPKSARCVMLYSFGRPTFPVDAHVGRVLARLGGLLDLGIDLTPMDHKARQRALRDAIPPDLRYGLHVNLLTHGREVCGARRPLCDSCVLASECAFASDLIGRGPGKRTPST